MATWWDKREARRKNVTTIATCAVVLIVLGAQSFVLMVDRFYLSLAMVSAILGLLAVTVWYLIARARDMRDRKAHPHRCRECGYDVSGSIAAGGARCSECGAEFTHAEKKPGWRGF